MKMLILERDDFVNVGLGMTFDDMLAELDVRDENGDVIKGVDSISLNVSSVKTRPGWKTYLKKEDKEAK